VDRPQQPQCLFVRHVLAAQFDPRFAADKFGMRFRHFAIQNK
jgi:hypothetical protein